MYQLRRFPIAMTGVDCSSVWTKFPRYGYLWDYGAETDAAGKIAQLARYHLNGLQFYDWQYRHHMPVSPDTESWQDWSGREISGAAVRSYLDVAHQMGMMGINDNNFPDKVCHYVNVKTLSINVKNQFVNGRILFSNGNGYS